MSEVETIKSALSQNVQLSTLPGAMEFFERVIIAYARNECSERNLRALTYSLRGYLDFLKHRDDLEIEKRIDAIESALEARK